MSFIPSTVASGGLLPEDNYFLLKTELPAAQTLSQSGNTITLSGGGGSVNVASATAVALTTQKTTAISYSTGLLATNIDGILAIGEGSAIGSTRVEGGNIIVQRDDAPAAVEFVSGANAASIEYDGTDITMSTLPLATDTTVSAANQMIPRSYLDNLINIALPAIAGYLPGTVGNLNKNINKSTGNLTQAAGDGNLYFVYPFIDTTVGNIVTYTGGTGLITTATYVGFSLVEFPSLTASSGTVVATTGNVVGAPYNLWKLANTRYKVPFTTSYTLKAGFKYAIATIHNNTTTVSSLGFGMGGALYSIGTFPYDVQTSATYTGAGVVPPLGATITQNAGGSGFVINYVLEP